MIALLLVAVWVFGSFPLAVIVGRRLRTTD
jgi:glycerol-3-phosphate acyltransferase PlsY